MTQNKTVYVFRRTGAGQARRYVGKHCRKPTRAQIVRAAVLKYTFLTVAGIILFGAGASYAYKIRGYAAVGGEVFALFLPVIWYAVGKTVGDLIEALKDGGGCWRR